MLGDDLIDKKDDLLARMIAARQRYGGSIVALMEVPADQISAYGCAAFKPTDEPGHRRDHRPGREAGRRARRRPTGS